MFLHVNVKNYEYNDLAILFNNFRFPPTEWKI